MGEHQQSDVIKGTKEQPNLGEGGTGIGRGWRELRSQFTHGGPWGLTWGHHSLCLGVVGAHSGSVALAELGLDAPVERVVLHQLEVNAALALLHSLRWRFTLEGRLFGRQHIQGGPSGQIVWFS